MFLFAYTCYNSISITCNKTNIPHHIVTLLKGYLHLSFFFITRNFVPIFYGKSDLMPSINLIICKEV